MNAISNSKAELLQITVNYKQKSEAWNKRE